MGIWEGLLDDSTGLHAQFLSILAQPSWSNALTNLKVLGLMVLEEWV